MSLVDKVYNTNKEPDDSQQEITRQIAMLSDTRKRLQKELNEVQEQLIKLTIKLGCDYE